VAGHYDKVVDRESAYEILKGKKAPDQGTPEDAEAKAKRDEFERNRNQGPASKTSAKNSVAGAVFRAFMSFTTSAARSVGSFVGRQITRGIFGNMTGGRSRR
jgi:hypothetical protein